MTFDTPIQRLAELRTIVEKACQEKWEVILYDEFGRDTVSFSDFRDDSVNVFDGAGDFRLALETIVTLTRDGDKKITVYL